GGSVRRSGGGARRSIAAMDPAPTITAPSTANTPATPMGPTSLFSIATLIWGSTWLAITFQLGVVSPEASVVYRFALAALLLGAWFLETGRLLRFPLAQHVMIVE